MDKTEFLLRLKLQKGIGYLKLLQIAGQLDTENVDALQLETLQLPVQLKEYCLQAFYDEKAASMIERIRQQCQVISFFDQLYPEKLRQIYKPPLLLFASGNLKLLQQRVVTIVGSRQGTSYSEKVIRGLMPSLVAHHNVIASGLARGVDAMAHCAALNSDGKTIAVVGNGLNHFYPISNHSLQERIMREGLVISEYLPDTPPRPFRFPERNRILAGLSESVIVTEAKQKSGSLITANLALQENRNVYAVPGPITASLSMGPNQLIEAGASPIVDFEWHEERFDKPAGSILFSD